MDLAGTFLSLAARSVLIKAPSSSQAQDAALSRREHGFESHRGHYPI